MVPNRTNNDTNQLQASRSKPLGNTAQKRLARAGNMTNIAKIASESKLSSKEQEIMQKLDTFYSNGHAKINGAKWTKKSIKWNKRKKQLALNIKDSDDGTTFNRNNESVFQILQRSIIFNSNDEYKS